MFQHLNPLKLKFDSTVIKPVVTYESEIWTWMKNGNAFRIRKENSVKQFTETNLFRHNQSTTSGYGTRER